MNNAISASATALPDRRRFLTAGAAVVASAAVPAALASVSTIAGMIAEYRRAQGAYNAALEIDEDHPDLSRLADEEDVALEALCAHPVASIDDVRAKSAALLEHVKYFALPEDCYTALLRSFAA